MKCNRKIKGEAAANSYIVVVFNVHQGDPSLMLNILRGKWGFYSYHNFQQLYSVFSQRLDQGGMQTPDKTSYCQDHAGGERGERIRCSLFSLCLEDMRFRCCR